MAKGGSLCQQLGWTVCLGTVTRESPVSDTPGGTRARACWAAVKHQEPMQVCECVCVCVCAAGVSWGENVSSVNAYVCVCRSEHQQAQWGCGSTDSQTRSQHLGRLRSRRVTGQIGCLSPAAVGVTLHLCVGVYSPVSMCIPTYEPPICPDREGNQDEAVGAACFCASAVGVNQCGQLYVHSNTIYYDFSF